MRSNLKLIGATVLFTLSILLTPSLAGASSSSPSNGNPIGEADSAGERKDFGKSL